MKLFIHENAYENIVCEMADILSRGRWVKLYVMEKENAPRQHEWTDGLVQGKLEAMLVYN